MVDYKQKIADLFSLRGELDPAVREAADEWTTMSVSIELSGGGKASFASRGGYPDRAEITRRSEEAEPALEALLQACVERAPALVKNEFAVLPLARLAAWVARDRWVRPLEEWEGVDGGVDADASLRSLSAHLLERWDDVPSALHGALAFTGSDRTAGVPEVAHRVAYAFTSAHVAVGAGDASPRDALQSAVSADSEIVVSKAVSKAFVASDGVNPLQALRKAQVVAQGADAWVADAVCASRMGSSLLGAAEENATEGGVTEGFGQSLLAWTCLHAEELGEPAELATAIDFCLQMRQQDSGYSLAGRTPKTLKQAMDAYALTTVTFDQDEIFQPNPRGISGLFLENATIPAGTVVAVPYDDALNGGPGRYELGPGSKEGRGERPCTVRVAEVGSLRRLIYEGKMLDNCLEDRYDSQLKYVQRARQRVSSFWSFTFTYEGADEPVYILLAEVWHLREGNVIRQAEGPRPRTIPGPEAWYWIGEWCRREGIDLSTWDIYSRVGAPIPAPPVL